jgi:type IV pilus assembly protein PilB
LGYVKEDDILLTMKQQLNIPIIDLNRIVVAEEVLKLLPEAVARKYEVMPVDINSNRLVVAMNDPTNYFALDDIRLAAGMLIRPVLARKADILKSIDRHYGRSEAEKAAKEYARQVSPVAAAVELMTASVPVGLEDEDTPVIRFLNTVIENAINNYASDIHIEPIEDELQGALSGWTA